MSPYVWFLLALGAAPGGRAQASPAAPTPGDCALDEEVSEDASGSLHLLQAGMSPRLASSAVPSHRSALAANHTLQDLRGAGHLDAPGAPRLCLGHLAEDGTLERDVLRHAGLFPKRGACATTPGAALVEAGASGRAAVAIPVLSSRGTDRFVTYAVVLVWIMLWLVLVTRQVGPLLFPRLGQRAELPGAEMLLPGTKGFEEPIKHSKAHFTKGGKDGIVRFEQQAWDRSFWSWATQEWAIMYPMKWGVPMTEEESRAQIKPEMMGGNGHPDDDAAACGKRLSEFWEQEYKSKGEHTWIWPVLLKNVGVWNFARLSGFQLFAQFMGTIWGVKIIEVATKYMTYMVRERAAHPNLYIPTALPMLAAFFVYFINPVICGLMGRTSCMIDSRICMRMQQGLSAMVFQKAQRLPVSYNGDDEIEADDSDQLKHVNLINMVNFDIGTATMACTSSLIQIVMLFPFGIMLCAMAWNHLHASLFIGLGGLAPAYIVIMVLINVQRIFVRRREIASHKRLHLFQELMMGIRTVKSCAWEEVGAQDLERLRREEMVWLFWFYRCMGSILVFTMISNKLVVLATICGNIWLYHKMDTSVIFVCIQLMWSLKGIFFGLSTAAAQITMLFPAMTRVSNFLKAKEAPMYNTELLTSSVKVIENSQLDAAQPTIRLKGDFAWAASAPPALKGLDLSIAPGERVAVVGEVGSGKTTLLHAMLAELHPCEGASVQRPERVAYSGQTPWIFEGTLKANILFWQEYKDELYKAVVEGSGLLMDLKLLPDGESTEIGAHGIRLSGGQKARVSLARAAYAPNTKAVLLDDPFAALDSCTSKHVLERLVLGPFWKDTPVVVVMQPEIERIVVFDRVLVVDGGRIIRSGTPQEVIPSPEFRRILSTRQQESAEEELERTLEVTGGPEKVQVSTADLQGQRQGEVSTLRDDEFAGRADWDTFLGYVRIGGWGYMIGNLICTSMLAGMLQMAEAQLAHWANVAVLDEKENSNWDYVVRYVCWLAVGFVFFAPTWALGMRFSTNVSRWMYDKCVESVLHAPIDKFFDKHPTSRIMNRMSGDMVMIDMSLYLKLAGCLDAILWFFIPLFYVHFVMPWYFSAASTIPYCIMLYLCMKFWRVLIPLRYLSLTEGSKRNSFFLEVQGDSVSMRAYNETKRHAEQEYAAQDVVSSLQWACQYIEMWVSCALQFSLMIQILVLATVTILFPGWIGAGSLGLSLVILGSVAGSAPDRLKQVASLQFEFIHLHRISELQPPNLPQEKANVLPGDARLAPFEVTISRADFPKLRVERELIGGPLQVMDENGRALLVQSVHGKSLVTAPLCRLAELCPSCRDLEDKSEGEFKHHIVAVNGIRSDIAAMAEELCGDVETLRLQFRSDWVMDGALVEIRDLRVGYGDPAQNPDVVKSITTTWQARSKVGIVGRTGCGKSSLLLVLLRLLEPRGGRVLINGVDHRSLGLWTLRKALGYVSQDPVLFAGSIKHNLDPFKMYSEEDMWDALRCVRLEQVVREMQTLLESEVGPGGCNFSFGQRQMICLARMILRQPALLLLDEATSAIDPATQECVQKALHDNFPTTTMVAIAHRLETVMDFDHIMVMDDGNIFEQGTLASLRDDPDSRFSKMLAAKRVW